MHTGQGLDRFLIFEKAGDGNGLRLRLGSIRHPRIGGLHSEPTASMHSTSCRVEGPVLLWGEEAHSFVLTEEGLVLDAVVRLDERSWYSATTERLSDGTVRWREFLVRFKQDPLQHDQGRATVHRRVGERVVTEATTYRVKEDSTTRFKRVVFHSRNVVPDIILLGGGKYAAQGQFGRARLFRPADVTIRKRLLVTYEIKRQ